MRRVLIVGLFLSLLSAQSNAPSTRAEFLKKFAQAAFDRSLYSVRYEEKYLTIKYPGGDVPADTGVCTDEVIRAYRALSIDLQKEVHEDMTSNFAVYPQIYGLNHPDANIDHRRVPNLDVFFMRKGERLRISSRPEDYYPGELVTWLLPNGRHHIGMIVDRKSNDKWRCLVVHNIGSGPKMEDVLFEWKITGHYRYYGPKPPTQ